MARLIKKKVAGATLIEALIALVIIMIVFTMAITLFGNVMRTGISLKKIQVQNQLDLLCKQIQKEGYIKAESLEVDSVNYIFLTDTSAVSGISKISIKATQNGHLLGIIKSLYKTKEDED